MNRYQNHYY